jgi:hypothetical protein
VCFSLERDVVGDLGPVLVAALRPLLEQGVGPGAADPGQAQLPVDVAHARRSQSPPRIFPAGDLGRPLELLDAVLLDLLFDLQLVQFLQQKGGAARDLLDGGKPPVRYGSRTNRGWPDASPVWRRLTP